jgi:hypothetical protein
VSASGFIFALQMVSPLWKANPFLRDAAHEHLDELVEPAHQNFPMPPVNE